MNNDQKESEQKESEKIIWFDKRVQTPTVLQMEGAECGAAALGIVLGYHGKFVSLEKLRDECGVSRDGTKAVNLLKVARKYGMVAKGFKKEPEQLYELPVPMILFWNFSHFVVLEGIKGKQVYINDPGSGPRIVSKKELNESFTGVVLAFEPGKGFEKGGKKKDTFTSLKKRLAGFKDALSYAVLAGIFLVIPGIAIPSFSKIFVDNVLVQYMQGWLKPLLVAMALTALFRLALTWLQQYYLLRMQTKLSVSMSSDFLFHVLRLPIKFFSQRFSGDIISRVKLNDEVAQLLSKVLANNILNLGMIGFFAVIMFSYDAVLTLIGISIAVFNVLFLKSVARFRIDLNRRLQQDNGRLIGASAIGLDMIESLKSSGTDSDFFSIWAGFQARVINARQLMMLSTQVVTLTSLFLSSLNQIIILAIGGARVMDGYLSIGMLVAFQSLMSSFMKPVEDLVKLGATIQETRANLDRLDDILYHDLDKQFTENPPQGFNDRLTGLIELRNITFGYSPLEPPLIEKFNLIIQPGSRVAIVGHSGSGKTTLAKLVVGLYEPWEGEILFDNMLLHSIPRHIFHQYVCIVDQDIFLFEGTIRENLSMWDITVPERDIIQAAKDAYIHDVIAAKPGGYLNKVEEIGRNFSGGERQRLDIARALASNPTCLILDEATSALNPDMEEMIDDHIRRRGCTCLIIAHRLSTIRDCDEIIVLKEGKAVERGTHDELMSLNGYYSELIEAH